MTATSEPTAVETPTFGHYIAGEAEQVSKFYHPALRMDGSEVTLQISEGGGPCGVWAEQNGEPVVEMKT